MWGARAEHNLGDPGGLQVQASLFSMGKLRLREAAQPLRRCRALSRPRLVSCLCLHHGGKEDKTEDHAKEDTVAYFVLKPSGMPEGPRRIFSSLPGWSFGKPAAALKPLSQQEPGRVVAPGPSSHGDEAAWTGTALGSTRLTLSSNAWAGGSSHLAAVSRRKL